MISGERSQLKKKKKRKIGRKKREKYVLYHATYVKFKMGKTNLY